MIRFIAIHPTKAIVISDLPIEKLKHKFGHKFEILNTVADKNNIDAMRTRLARSYPTYTFKELLRKIRRPHSAETKERIGLSKVGKPRDAATIEKIKTTMAGKSNFAGKKHSAETRAKMAAAKRGKPNICKGTVWVHDPVSGLEKRVSEVPEGHRRGRDYYSTEAVILSNKTKTTYS